MVIDRWKIAQHLWSLDKKMPSRHYRLFGILLCHTPEHEDIAILQETVDP